LCRCFSDDIPPVFRRSARLRGFIQGDLADF
jgi:hypothetical protein